MPALSEYLFPQFRTGASPRSHSTITVMSLVTAGARACSSSTIGSIQAPGTLRVQDFARPYGNRDRTPVDHADDDGGGVCPFQRRVNRQGQPVRTPHRREDPSQEGREAEAHIQFGLAGTRPVAAVRGA